MPNIFDEGASSPSVSFITQKLLDLRLFETSATTSNQGITHFDAPFRLKENLREKLLKSNARN